MIRIRVPATTANIGPGFDSLGMALNLYNEFIFEETAEGLEIIGALDYEEDEDNLVYRSMVKTFATIGYKPKGMKITIETNIPVSRGLGSSSTCILGGILGANEMAGSPLSKDQVFTLATEIEGHPDNIAPALFGGFISSLMQDDHIYYNRIQMAQGLKFVAMIPDFTLSTKKARQVLPQSVSHKIAVENISRVSLLISALVNGRFDLLKPALKDSMHQPYRGKLVKGFDEVLDQSYEFGALGAYLSGAGPTIMAMIGEEDSGFKEKMKSSLDSMEYNWQVMDLELDLDGAKVVTSQR